MTTDLYNMKREKVGTVELPDRVFGVAWKSAVVKQALNAQLANRRIPWAKVKDRSEVRGGGKKPWRQKGTGRARHGSTRSPIWVGGGKAHGPNAGRDYSQKVNKKVRRAAIAMLLSKKFADGRLVVLDGMSIEAPKTKMLAAQLREFMSLPKTAKKFDMLVVPAVENKAIIRAGRNLSKTKIAHPGSLNAYDIMNHTHMMLDKGAVQEIVRHFAVAARTAGAGVRTGAEAEAK